MFSFFSLKPNAVCVVFSLFRSYFFIAGVAILDEAAPAASTAGMSPSTFLLAFFFDN